MPLAVILTSLAEWMRILILLALPAATIACIPVKNPDKGISAGCTVFGAASLADCNTISEANGAPVGSCVPNTAITSMSILCPPGKVIFVYGSNKNAALGATTATCDAKSKQWNFHDTDGNDNSQADVFVGPPITVACTAP